MKGQIFWGVIVLIFTIIFSAQVVLGISDSVNVSLEVSSSCGNGVCDSSQGENENNCSLDCGCNNNGICESDREETYENCATDCPPPTRTPTPTPTSTSTPAIGAILITDIIPPLILDLSVRNITQDSAEISWRTSESALCILYWGKTYEYKEGAISEMGFHRQHLTKFTNLSPQTSYHFKIICRDTNQNKVESSDQQFITLALPDISPPPNVSNLSAIPGLSLIHI